MTAYPISSGVTSNGLSLMPGDIETVFGGGTSVRSIVGRGAILDVKAGGASLSATVNSGGSITVESGGNASSTVVNSGGFETVAGQETGSLIGSGGTQAVGGSGVALNTTVNSGGLQIVSFDQSGDGSVVGGTATSTTLNGGTERVYTSGTASNITIRQGGLLELGHGASFYGGHATNVVISAGGVAFLNYLGVLDSVVVQSGGILRDVAGRVTGAILSGGTEFVGGDVGAVDYGAIISAGGLQSVSGYGGIAYGATVNSGGQQLISNENLAVATVVNSGGLQTVEWEARTSGTVVNSGGRQLVQNTVDSGSSIRPSTAFETVVNSGGFQTVGVAGQTSGTILFNGAVENVLSGGTALGTTVQFGGVVVANAGARLSGTIINAGGRQVILSGGTASGTFLKLGGSIDLAFLPFNGASETIKALGNVFTVTSGAQSYSQQLGNSLPGTLKLSNDGIGGTLVTQVGSLSAEGALSANVTIGSGSNLQGIASASIVAAMDQALAAWGTYIDVGRNLSIEIDVGATPYSSEVAVNTSKLQPAPNGQVIGPYTNGVRVTAPQAQLALENRGSSPAPDITITINPQMLNQIYFATNPASSTYSVPTDKIDGVSLFKHELGHAFGITGLRDQSGQLPGAESIFDSFTRIDASGKAYFVGAQAMAQYGGPVPLTTGFNNGANYYAVDAAATGLTNDLMGPSLAKGQVYQISGLDLAMLEDIGVPAGLDYSTGGLPAKPDVPVQFAAPRAVNVTITPGQRQGDSPSISWQAPNIVNSTKYNAFGVQVQLWLTTTPYTSNGAGYEVSSAAGNATVSANTTISEATPTSATLLPPTGNYYATIVLAEDYNGTGNYVTEDRIAYSGAGPNGTIYINNPGVSASISYTPPTPDEGSGGGDGGQDGGGGGSGGNDNGGGSNATEPSLSTPPGPLIDSDPIGVSTTPVYRFFDSVHGTQFLTSSGGEASSVQTSRPDLVFEGVGLQSVAGGASDPSASPVYRFFDTIYGTHFYSSDATERDTIQTTRPDLTYEGTGFYEFSTPQAGAAPVYRFFEATNGTHFYTANEAERSGILQTRADLIPEGTAFYAPNS